MIESAAEDIANELAKTYVHDGGVSFQGKSLKLNSEADCREIISAINNCKKLEFLNLEGNTLGVDAAKAIAKSLEAKCELKRALWKDMFTGRMKEEIPKALEHLGTGLTIAKAQLTELDLSDNAFGPIGVSGLASLLSSPSCYQLQELKLNNNGLGISGSKMLAEALINCHKNSKKEGKTFGLKVLIIGRNRLENDGAIALANVFKILGSLEEISMPQNGIYHKGIKALSDAFKKNQSLRLINLNDNTITKKGAEHIAKALPFLQNLELLNLGDCLLKTEGAKILASALGTKHIKLEELNLGFNEIKMEGGLAIAKAMTNKVKLKKLMLNGNEFGTNGKALIREILIMNKKISALETLSEDEGNSDDNVDDGDDDDDNDDNEEEEEEEEEEQDEKGNTHSSLSFKKSESDFSRVIPNNESENLTAFLENMSIKPVPQGTLKIFLDNPTLDHLLEVKENQITEFINANQDHSVDFYTETYIPLLVKLSSFSSSYSQEIKSLSTKLSLLLYKDLFKWAMDKNQLPIVNNVLFVYFGLIKSEDKNFKINWDVKGSLAALNGAISENFIPQQTRDSLNLLLEMQTEKQKTNSVILVQ